MAKKMNVRQLSDRQRTLSQTRKLSRLRLAADSDGYRIVKSRTRRFDAQHQGLYAVFDNDTNFPVLGWDYDATLEDIANWLAGGD